MELRYEGKLSSGLKSCSLFTMMAQCHSCFISPTLKPRLCHLGQQMTPYPSEAINFSPAGNPPLTLGTDANITSTCLSGRQKNQNDLTQTLTEIFFLARSWIL